MLSPYLPLWRTEYPKSFELLENYLSDSVDINKMFLFQDGFAPPEETLGQEEEEY